MFGPEPSDLVDEVHRSLRYRLMAHTAEDLCEMHMDPKLMELCHHDDINHGFVMVFYDNPPQIDLMELERRVNEDIAKDMPIAYADERHVRIGDTLHLCGGPRTHVTTTGKVEGFRLCHEIIYDNQRNRYLLIGLVGEHSEDRIRKLHHATQEPDMMGPFIYK